MDRQKTMHDFMQEELIRYETLYAKLYKEYQSLPKGSLAKDGQGNLYRYTREGGRQYKVMLPKKEWRLVLALKRRRYMGKGMKLLQKRIVSCKNFLKSDELYDPKLIERSLPVQYKGLVGVNVFLDQDINVEEWMKARYRSNPMDIHTPHYTAGGICTRSKSEAMIGSRLEERGILFRYESEVRLGCRKVYPDFAILHERRRRVIYWEHFGIIDDEKYVFSNLKKLEQYARHGIYFGKNLFITYESKRKPLTIKAVDMKIDEILHESCNWI